MHEIKLLTLLFKLIHIHSNKLGPVRVCVAPCYGEGLSHSPF